jgi:hypothetical protein
MAILTHKRSTIFAAVALTVGISAGSVCFAPTLAKDQIQVSQLSNEIDIGSMSASHKARCIMPPAWRRDCGE